MDTDVTQTEPPLCPVCQHLQPQMLVTIECKDYWACLRCQARFLSPRHYLSAKDEHRHYRNHENDPADPAYRAFLSKLAKPLLARLSPGRKVLDYGAGPGPALAAMLSEAGHDVTIYDPVFAPNVETLTKTYDVITCTETAEHFHDPAEEFAKLSSLLHPGGVLAIMTCFQTDDAKFANWHYRKDPTHVVFYREETFRFIAHHFGWTLDIPIKDVALMQKG